MSIWVGDESRKIPLLDNLKMKDQETTVLTQV